MAAALFISLVGVLLIVTALPRLGSAQKAPPQGEESGGTFAGDMSKTQIALLLLAGLVMVTVWLLRQAR